ncbi:hypothetical protein Tco_0946612, partial [Tanacetum coccineum]
MINIPVPRLIENTKDHVKWRNSNGKLVEFTVKSAWWDLRDQMDSVKWWKENCSSADMIGNGSWNWPVEWLQQIPILNNITVLSLNENTKDHVKWRNSDEKL